MCVDNVACEVNQHITFRARFRVTEPNARTPFCVNATWCTAFHFHRNRGTMPRRYKSKESITFAVLIDFLPAKALTHGLVDDGLMRSCSRATGIEGAAASEPTLFYSKSHEMK